MSFGSICRQLFSRYHSRVLYRIPTFAISFLICSSTVAAGNPPPSTALLNGARAVVLNSQTGKAYAVDAGHNAISIFDPEKNSIASVPVGASPVAIAINDTTNRVYVANNGGASVTVVAGQTDTALATVSVGALPYVLAVNPATNKIYVSNTFSKPITTIDGATNSTTTVKAGSADAIAIDTRRDRLYLAGYEDVNLLVLDGKAAVVGKVPAGIHPWGMALDETAATLYVTRSGDAQL